MGVAVLPMYDWPEIQSENDALWVTMRDRLRAEGINAPDGLDRTAGYRDSWLRDDLVLSQACGLPFATDLMGHVEFIGALDFGLEGCGPGQYRSHIVVSKDANLEINDLNGLEFAYNSKCSQSGFACLQSAGLTSGNGLETGGHRESIHAVASGRAKFAAIDANTWRMAERFEPLIEGLQILTSTPRTPAPVLIAAKGADVDAYRRALDIERADPSVYRGFL